MSKDYKGYEILEKIDKGQILEGTILLFTSTISKNKIKGVVVKKPEGLQVYRESDLDVLPVSWFLNSKIEIIEEEPEIDIQGIEELITYEGSKAIYVEAYLYEKVNELIKAIKQIDKKLKGE